MAIEITGRIVNLLEPVTGQGKNGQWKKQEFIIETTDQYPKKVIFSMWGEKVDVLTNYKVGEDVKVSFNPESREYNGRWYTDLRAWRIDRAGAASQPGVNQEREYNFNQERAAGPTTFSQPQPQGSGMMNDDLPF